MHNIIGNGSLKRTLLHPCGYGLLPRWIVPVFVGSLSGHWGNLWCECTQPWVNWSHESIWNWSHNRKLRSCAYVMEYTVCCIIMLFRCKVKLKLRSTCVPEAFIKDRDKYLHPTLSAGWNYFFLPLIHRHTIAWRNPDDVDVMWCHLATVV